MRLQEKYANASSAPIPFNVRGSAAISVVACIGVGVLILALLVAVIRQRTMPDTMMPLRAGDMMPALDGVGLDGNEHTWAYCDAPPALIVVFSTWCGNCRGEITEIKKMQETNQLEGYDIIGVSVDLDPDDIKIMCGEEDVDWTILRVPDGIDDKTIRRMGVRTLPHIFLVDAEGVIQVEDKHISTISNYIAMSPKTKMLSKTP